MNRGFGGVKLISFYRTFIVGIFIITLLLHEFSQIAFNFLNEVENVNSILMQSIRKC